jgi:16S rRNA G966 N2-methylase RsmD
VAGAADEVAAVAVEAASADGDAVAEVEEATRSVPVAEHFVREHGVRVNNEIFERHTQT